MQSVPLRQVPLLPAGRAPISLSLMTNTALWRVRISDTGYVCDNRLTRMWDVRLRWGARFNRALREFVDLLVGLEQSGWGDEPQWELGNVDPVMEANLALPASMS